MSKYILSLLACASLYAGDMVAWKAPKNMTLFTDGQSFAVESNGTLHEIQSCFVDAKLRDKSVACIQAMQNNGYLDIKQLDTDIYKVDFKERALGGGPVTGAIAYVLVKIGIWGFSIISTPVMGPVGPAVTVVVGETAPAAVSAVLTATPFLP